MEREKKKEKKDQKRLNREILEHGEDEGGTSTCGNSDSHDPVGDGEVDGGETGDAADDHGEDDPELVAEDAGVGVGVGAGAEAGDEVLGGAEEVGGGGDELEDEAEEAGDGEDDVELAEEGAEDDGRDDAAEADGDAAARRVGGGPEDEGEEAAVLDGVLGVGEEGADVGAEGGGDEREGVDEVEDGEEDDDELDDLGPPELRAGPPAAVAAGVGAPVERDEGVGRVEVDRADGADERVEEERDELRGREDALERALVAARRDDVGDVPVQVERERGAREHEAKALPLELPHVREEAARAAAARIKEAASADAAVKEETCRGGGGSVGVREGPGDGPGDGDGDEHDAKGEEAVDGKDELEDALLGDGHERERDDDERVGADGGVVRHLAAVAGLVVDVAALAGDEELEAEHRDARADGRDVRPERAERVAHDHELRHEHARAPAKELREARVRVLLVVDRVHGALARREERARSPRGPTTRTAPGRTQRSRT